MYKKLDGHNENLLNEKYQTEKAQIVCGSIYIIPWKCQNYILEKKLVCLVIVMEGVRQKL
jgi:hypothetical protein